MSLTFEDGIECIEGHNAGMPVKVVFLPNVQGHTMQEKKEYCSTKLDHIRKLLTFEPRSGANSYGILVTSPSSRDGHFGAIYFDPSGWHDMCGHATMFLGSLAVQRKLVPVGNGKSTKVLIDTPAGRVEVHLHLSDHWAVENVSLVNVPSFVHSIFKVDLNGIGEIEIPIVFGGDFYAMIDMNSLGMRYSREILPRLFNLSSEIMDRLSGETIVHPVMKDVKGLYGVRYHSGIDDGGNPMKMYGVLFFGSNKKMMLDRSPSGTSSSAHLAYLYFLRKKIKLKQEVEFLSSIDTRFRGRAIEEVNVGSYCAILPEISTVDKGCFITGFSTYVVDAQDELGHGFQPIEPF